MSCFGNLLECLQGPSFFATSSYAQLSDLPQVKLDIIGAGPDLVIVKDGGRICGTGAAMANAPLVQDKSYFEVKIQQTGTWGVGLSNKGGSQDLSRIPLGNDNMSWVLRQDGSFYHNGNEINRLDQPPSEGDIYGLAFDHLELRVLKNGLDTNKTISGIKSTSFPVLYVGDEAILDVKFRDFWYKPPFGYEEIMIEKTIF